MPPANSTMLPLGTIAPDFTLQAADGTTHDLNGSLGAHGVLVVFMCNHCPYVKHIYDELTKLGHDCATMGIGMVGIMSNDIENYPDDAPEKMAETAAANGWTFPYLFDADQSVAKAYTAACTPDFFLFDGARDHGHDRPGRRGRSGHGRPDRPDRLGRHGRTRARPCGLRRGPSSSRGRPHGR